jgi:hypothetical protein
MNYHYVECQTAGCGSVVTYSDAFSCPNITWENDGRKNHYEDIFCRECAAETEYLCTDCGETMEPLES